MSSTGKRTLGSICVYEREDGSLTFVTAGMFRQLATRGCWGDVPVGRRLVIEVESHGAKTAALRGGIA